MKAAIVALIVNAVFSVALMFPLKHGGIALATSIASAVNVGMLWVILNRRIGTILDSEFYLSLGKTVLASLVMWGVILLIGLLYPWHTSGPFDARLIYLILCVAGGAAAFFTTAFFVKSPEIAITLKSVRRRIASKRNGVTQGSKARKSPVY